jgi:hypothetical protein
MLFGQQVRSSISVSSATHAPSRTLAVVVVGDLPHLGGEGEDRRADVVGQVEPDRVFSWREAIQLRNP